MNCCFFGHRDSPERIRPILKSALTDLILNSGVDEFYIGNHGNFDRMTTGVLEELSKSLNIRYYIVLSYLPAEKDKTYIQHTILPEGIENVPPKFAIAYCNKCMLNKSDYVITYVTHSWGGAAQFKALAEKKNKEIIELS